MKFDAFTKTYEGRCVLTMPAMEVSPGRVTAIIGANGSGKTTMAKIFAELESADARGWKPPAGRVGYLPQKSFAFRLTTERNVMLCGDDKELAAQMMEELGLTGLARNRAKRLSGGETAKMALARMLMGSYDLIILDEPTAAMDMESTLVAEGLVRRYVQEHDAAAIIITHNLSQARRLADDVWFLQKGHLVESGPADAVLNSPACPETQEFLEFYG